ncbi:MAG: tRNA(Met) cytidine acetyltransferase, partial [Gammaproteobacteria bacterium]|nr:tRNA(Met) cytidine acetyltransferase [Gammaproteobacteria bacterium]
SLSIIVTAPRLAAVQPLFQQAKKLLPGASVHEGCVQWKNASIQFVAPDVLCLSTVPADLLLVDEAAAIPATLLQQLLTRYSRIVFSTTTHGYEGTGRGFAVRFKQTLNEQTPDWKQITLHTPIRWAENDPLESLAFKILLLDAASADDECVTAAAVDNVVMEKINRNELVNNESLLAQIFGLLVVAHYRTRPNDLRNLLDGPGLSVYVSRYQGQVVATALIAAEGGFDEQIAEAVFAGRRRPRGHLIPQSLMVHAGLKDAARLHCARVMRIAVHPALQRKGLGRQLLRRIKADAEKQGADLLGASFGATESLLHFWSYENILPVRMGFRRGHASGEYSVMVLVALSAAGENVYSAARTRFKRDLPQWLADPLQTLDVAVSAVLSQGIDGDTEIVSLDQHDLDMLFSFSRGERTYEDALAPIWRLLIEAKIQLADSPVSAEQDVLVAKVLQKQPWVNVARQFGLAGKADVLVHLRGGVSQLLDAVGVSF